MIYLTLAVVYGMDGKMPTYDYECREHGRFSDVRTIEERGHAPCPICKRRCKKLLSAPAVHKFENQLGYFEHIAREPVYAKSKKHLRELCNQHECYAPGVLD